MYHTHTEGLSKYRHSRFRAFFASILFTSLHTPSSCELLRIPEKSRGVTVP